MPTPIQHLAIAEEILASPAFPQGLRTRLYDSKDVRGAFLFGHIAPDVQVVNQQPRETTHFFTVPPSNRHPAYQRMLTTYPSLAQPFDQPATRAVFLVGYMAHLLLDELWVREIFIPVFGPEQCWGNQRERLLLHNVLRAWLDRRELPRLRNGIANLLRQAQPNGWLPFATDADLCCWRDLVAEQFEPDSAIRTVEVFANRARIPDAEFLALLEPGVMEERILSRISRDTLDKFHTRAVAYSHDLIVRRLNSCATGKSA